MSEAESYSKNAVEQAGHFATTRWSVVLAVGAEDSAQARIALQRLCQTYWYPLYAYVRRRGSKEHDAQDLIQGFFAVLLKRQALEKVTSSRGKFRSYLLTALNHFLIDQHHRQQAQKRGGGQPIFSLDLPAAEQLYQLEQPSTESPEQLYERRWAVTLLDNALKRLEEEFTEAGKGMLFEQLRHFTVADNPNEQWADAAAQLGMTVEAFKKAAQRLRRRYREAIRQEIAHTVATPGEIEEELRYLWAVVSE